jgi:hypothetical protein
MIQSIAKNAEPVLTSPYILRTRRNHGLEHATVHVLSGKYKGKSYAGRSDAGGFWLMADVTTEQVTEAVHEALRRMRAGEHSLAVHPKCGTSLLTTGTLTGLAALVGTAGSRGTLNSMFQRFPMTLLLTIGALITSEPIGLELQKYITTEGDPGNLEILEIRRVENPILGGTVHRIETQSS